MPIYKFDITNMNIDAGIEKLAMSIADLNQNVLAKVYSKYKTADFDEPALDIFVRRDEIIHLFEDIIVMRMDPQYNINEISGLIERVNFKIRNIRVKTTEILMGRAERYKMQTKPN